ncbi:hypothetical protein JCM10207_002423 [Rhodosporidiobolus poonsookiae]
MWPFTSSTPQQHTAPAPPSACPVDHDTRQTWLAQNPAASSSSAPTPHSFPAQQSAHDPHAQHLSTEREVSSIPRWLPPAANSSSSSAPHPVSSDVPPSACPMHESNVASSSSSSPPAAPALDASHLPSHPAEAAAASPSTDKWVYPSPASFYTALQRKDRNPQARDMGVVVPIHNAVNERVWVQVMEWEREAMGLEKGQEPGSKLVSFVGRPREMSPRARWKSLIGYTAPFDRHDWIVDRPVPSPSPSPSSSPSEAPQSIRIRYVIDFYTGRGAGLLTPPGPSGGEGDKGVEDNFRPNLAFFIDCRPALDGWEGARMRFNKYWGLGGPAQAQQGRGQK